MPRRPRGTIPGFPYHVTQRGNRKMGVFHNDTDRRVYLKLLLTQSLERALRIWAYCLMDNHVHVIAVPDREDSLSIVFQRVHGDYASYFNKRYEKTGHLWQGRFKACLLDEPHLFNAAQYVERNPVRAAMVARAENYYWSSAAAHCGLRLDPILSADLPLIEIVSDWSAWLSNEQRTEDLNFIRERTRTGRPCADDEFTRTLEKKLGRKLLPQRPCSKKVLMENATSTTPLFPESVGTE